MDRSRENPDDLVRKARSKLTPGFFGKMFSSKESRLEEALELYEAAANIYKMKKDWEHAGSSFEECAKISIDLSSDSASNYYNEAAHCYKFTNAEKRQLMLDNSIKIYEDRGKFQQAGKLTKEMANELEIEANYPLAIEKYQKAAELFAMESQNTRSLEQQCLLKVADLMCISQHKDMEKKAPEIYEKLGMQYLTVPLLKSSAKDMFFKCVVCYLACKDEITAGIKLKKYLEEDPTFDDTRESRFLQKAIEYSGEPANPEAFQQEVSNYKSYRDLDKWKLSMFSLILEKIKKSEESLA